MFSPSGSAAITDGATLVAAMEGTPEGWTVSGSNLQSLTDAFTITVATAESPAGASIPTQKALLTKNW